LATVGPVVPLISVLRSAALRRVPKPRQVGLQYSFEG
jgi:hypothetical protein